jgi:deaminated glutathione amidase
MKAALVQLCSGDDPAANLTVTEGFVREAAGNGAQLVLTPEVTNCVSTSRVRQNEVLQPETDDRTLARLRVVAEELGIWLLIGSLALKTEEERFANRSFLIGPDGRVAARYDKIHMFDVQLDNGESYRESAGFRPGSKAVIAQTPIARIGMTVCYDLRFAYLYRKLAQKGAQILTIPSAFTRPTGAAHWEVLMRARAIETGCFVLAPAQTGAHSGSSRTTYGHSLAVDPWGTVLADGGEATGVTMVDLDLDAVTRARARIPSLDHDRTFEGP